MFEFDKLYWLAGQSMVKQGIDKSAGFQRTFGLILILNKNPFFFIEEFIRIDMDVTTVI